MPALITTDLVALDADLGADKGAVVRRLAELVAGAGRATDADALHADVLAAVGRRRLSGPRWGHHERRAGGEPLAQGLVDPAVGGVAGAEVVGGDDQQAGVGVVAEPFGERGHSPRRYRLVSGSMATSGPPQAPHSPRPRARASCSAAASDPRWAPLGSMWSVAA